MALFSARSYGAGDQEWQAGLHGGREGRVLASGDHSSDSRWREWRDRVITVKMRDWPIKKVRLSRAVALCERAPPGPQAPDVNDT